MQSREATIERSNIFSRDGIGTNVLLIAAFIALMTVCSWVKIPGVIPVTLQTFAVGLTVGILGTKRGFAAIVAWLAIGLAGAPVFAGYVGGLPYLAGPTGGYVIGFLGMALVIGKLIEHFGKGMLALSAAMVAGLLVCYAFGTAWFMVVSGAAFTGAELSHVLEICIVPFIIPDAIKMGLAAGGTRLAHGFLASREK